MKKTNSIYALVLILIVTLGTTLFIYYSNDHKECHENVSTALDAQGNTVTIKQHVCKERYAL